LSSSRKKEKKENHAAAHDWANVNWIAPKIRKNLSMNVEAIL
jgi:hypothetical protein